MKQSSKIFLTLIVFTFLFLSLTISVDAFTWNRPTIIAATLNVNHSETSNSSDFWDDLDDPTDIDHALLNNLEWSVAGHTIDTNVDMDDNDILNIDQAYFGGGLYIHSGDAGHIDLHADWIDLHGNLSTIWTIELEADGDGLGGDSFGDLVFGSGGDTYLYYNGSDFIIDPDAVGSGDVVILGDLRADNLIGDGSNLTNINISSADHDLLNNLNWFDSGHTIDTDLDIGNYFGIARGFNATDWTNVSITESQISDLATYLKADGSVALTSTWNFDTPANPFNINGSGNFTTTGRIGIGTTVSNYPLDIVGSSDGASFRLASVATDATLKTYGFTGRHYTNAEEDVAVLAGQTDDDSTIFFWGGGSPNFNTATEHRFYAAADTTTTIGDVVMTISVDGVIILDDLNVTGTSYLGDLIIEADNITVNNIISKDGNISFWNGTDKKMVITQDGNVGIGTDVSDRLLEMRSSSPIIRLRDTGATNYSTTAFIEFGGTDGGKWNRTGYIGDGSSGNTDIILQAEESDLKLGDSTSYSVLTLSGGDATFTGNITAEWGFFNSLNISGQIIGPGSNFAQYQFTDNNFNGSGNGTFGFLFGDGSQLTGIAGGINDTNINVLTINSTSHTIFGNLTGSGGVINWTNSQDLTNLVRNGDFADGSIWTLLKFVISGGNANWDWDAIPNTPAQGHIRQAIVGLTIGEVYELTYTVTMSAPGVDDFIPTIAGVTLTNRAVSGTYTESFTALSITELKFNVLTFYDTPVIVTIDDVIITKYNPNTILGKLDINSVSADVYIRQGEEMLPPFFKNLGAFYIELVVPKSLDIGGYPSMPHILRGNLIVFGAFQSPGDFTLRVESDTELTVDMDFVNKAYSTEPLFVMQSKDDGSFEIGTANATDFIIYTNGSDKERFKILGGGGVRVLGDLNVTGTIYANAINISNSSFTFSHNENSSIDFTIQNLNGSSGASALITTKNDVGGIFGIGIGSSNFNLGGMLMPNITALFSRSDGIMGFINNFNQPFIWYNNPNDDDDANNLVELMRLDGKGLNVSGGNITSQNVFVPQYVYSHTDATIILTSSSAWVNVTFTQEDDNIKKGISHVYNDATNISYIINSDGIYSVEFDFDVIDTSASSTDIDVAGRVIYFNGTEVIGSVFETDITKKNIEVELSHSFLAKFFVGDIIVFQFVANDVDVQISSHKTFGVHPDSATIEIIKEANL